MAFILVVENGMGLPEANSYADAAFVSNYADLQGSDVWCNNSNLQDIALAQASAFIDLRYSARFCGELVNEDQGMLFPRKIRGKSTGIPKALKQAVAALALQYITDGGLDLNANAENAVKSTSVSVGNGAVSESTTYFDKPNGRISFSNFAVSDRYVTQVMKSIGCESGVDSAMFIEAWRA